jgi:hypothetical protein
VQGVAGLGGDEVVDQVGGQDEPDAVEQAPGAGKISETPQEPIPGPGDRPGHPLDTHVGPGRLTQQEGPARRVGPDARGVRIENSV